MATLDFIHNKTQIYTQTSCLHNDDLWAQLGSCFIYNHTKSPLLYMYMFQKIKSILILNYELTEYVVNKLLTQWCKAAHTYIYIYCMHIHKVNISVIFIHIAIYYKVRNSWSEFERVTPKWRVLSWESSKYQFKILQFWLSQCFTPDNSLYYILLGEHETQTRIQPFWKWVEIHGTAWNVHIIYNTNR